MITLSLNSTEHIIIVDGLIQRVTKEETEESMASDDLVEMEGLVTEVLRGGMFIVTVESTDKNGKTLERKITATLCGKIRQHKIRVVLGDKVTLGVTPYDLTRGRITYRHK